MYTPTKEELENLCFIIRPILNDTNIFASHSKITAIEYNSYNNIWRFSFKRFYPKNKNDIEILIRLFESMEG